MFRDCRCELAHPLADGLHQCGIVPQGVREALQTHEPGSVFEDAAELEGAHLHTVRQESVEELEGGVAYVLGVRPGIGLEVLPGLDGSAAFILPVAQTASPVHLGSRIGGRHLAAAEGEARDHGYVVVAHLIAEAEVHLHRLEQPSQVLRGHIDERLLDIAVEIDAEPLAEHGLHHAGVGEELDEGHRARRALAQDGAPEVLEVGLTLSAEPRCGRLGAHGRASSSAMRG